MTGNRIIFKRNLVSGSIPALSSLSAGEIAINPVDGKIFFKQTTVPGNPNFDKIVTLASVIDQPYAFDSNLSAVYINYGSNAVNQVFSTILGGLFNINSGAGSTIINGDNNKVYSDISFIGNGYNNAIYLSGAYSSILNGENNTITLSGDHSAILGGLNNTINHKNTFILGSNITTTQENCTYVNRLYSLSGIEIGTSKPISDLYISENGNVGIKTETPNVDLTVEGSISGRNIYSGFFYSLSGIEIGTSKPISDLYISENGNVGIKTETPNVDLTVEGSISGRNIYADNFFGNITTSDNIDASRITSGTLSAARLPSFFGDISVSTLNNILCARVIKIQENPVSAITPINQQVLQWNGTEWVPTTLTSSNWESIYSTVSSLSSNWSSVYTTTQTNSANWQSTYSTVSSLSSTWSSTYTTTQSNSANWQSTYSTVSSLSSTWDYQGTDLKALSANWQSTYSTVSSLSSNWSSVYTTTQSNSANWQTAYAYVSANSVNLTATNIFVNNNLTVTNTVSAKYYQGTLIDWMTLVRGYKTVPTLLQTIAGGDVYTYVFATTGTDRTYFRYIATDGSEDSFYGNFTSGTLSNLIARKAIIL